MVESFISPDIETMSKIEFDKINLEQILDERFDTFDTALANSPKNYGPKRDSIWDVLHSNQNPYLVSSDVDVLFKEQLLLVIENYLFDSGDSLSVWAFSKSLENTFKNTFLFNVKQIAYVRSIPRSKEFKDLLLEKKIGIKNLSREESTALGSRRMVDVFYNMILEENILNNNHLTNVSQARSVEVKNPDLVKPANRSCLEKELDVLNKLKRGVKKIYDIPFVDSKSLNPIINKLKPIVSNEYDNSISDIQLYHVYTILTELNSETANAVMSDMSVAEAKLLIRSNLPSEFSNFFTKTILGDKLLTYPAGGSSFQLVHSLLKNVGFNPDNAYKILANYGVKQTSTHTFNNR